MKNWFKSAVTGMILERPGQKLTFAQHAARLEANGESLRKQFGAARNSDTNREKLRHIIGIERWGQRRLMVALGDPLETPDEYDDYRPGDDMGWEALRLEFDDTRQMTVTLVQELDEAQADPTQVIPHNNYGPITLLAWLRYLDMHANWEGQRVS